MTRTEIENIIRKYNISDNGNGTIQAKYFGKLTDADVTTIKAAKAEILEYFAEIKIEKEERANKIAAIEGLEELRKANADWETYYDQLHNAIDRGYVRMPAQPASDTIALKAQYPRAAAYIKASNYSYASNDAKSVAGTKAMEKIINGENHETVIAEMENEWKQSAHEAMMHE